MFSSSADRLDSQGMYHLSLTYFADALPSEGLPEPFEEKDIYGSRFEKKDGTSVVLLCPGTDWDEQFAKDQAKPVGPRGLSQILDWVRRDQATGIKEVDDTLYLIPLAEANQREHWTALALRGDKVYFFDPKNETSYSLKSLTNLLQKHRFPAKDMSITYLGVQTILDAHRCGYYVAEVIGSLASQFIKKRAIDLDESLCQAPIDDVVADYRALVQERVAQEAKDFGELADFEDEDMVVIQHDKRPHPPVPNPKPAAVEESAGWIARSKHWSNGQWALFWLGAVIVMGLVVGASIITFGGAGVAIAAAIGGASFASAISAAWVTCLSLFTNVAFMATVSAMVGVMTTGFVFVLKQSKPSHPMPNDKPIVHEQSSSLSLSSSAKTSKQMKFHPATPFATSEYVFRSEELVSTNNNNDAYISLNKELVSTNSNNDACILRH